MQEQTIAQHNDALRAEIARLTAEQMRLKAKLVRALSLKVSEKGALSVYGMGRFPVTLYKNQWLRLLDAADSIRAFITANNSTLTEKGE